MYNSLGFHNLPANVILQNQANQQMNRPKRRSTRSAPASQESAAPGFAKGVLADAENLPSRPSNINSSSIMGFPPSKPVNSTAANKPLPRQRGQRPAAQQRPAKQQRPVPTPAARMPAGFHRENTVAAVSAARQKSPTTFPSAAAAMKMEEKYMDQAKQQDSLGERVQALESQDTLERQRVDLIDTAIQKNTLALNKLQEAIHRDGIMTKTTTSQMTTMQRTIHEQRTLIDELKDKLSNLSNVKDQVFWFFATANETVEVFDSMDAKEPLVGETLGKDEQVLLSYPMNKKDDKVWMITKQLYDNGDIQQRWVVFSTGTTLHFRDLTFSNEPVAAA